MVIQTLTEIINNGEFVLELEHPDEFLDIWIFIAPDRNNPVFVRLLGQGNSSQIFWTNESPVLLADDALGGEELSKNLFEKIVHNYQQM